MNGKIKEEMNKDIAFVILNYNVYQETKDCILSIIDKIDTDSFAIVVVDNNSKDGSIDKLQKDFERNNCVAFCRNSENLGFARGNNVGIRYAREKYNPKFICCLNNDTLLEQKGFYSKLIKTYEEYSPAVIGPKIFKRDGEVQAFNFHMQSIDAYRQHLEAIEYDENLSLSKRVKRHLLNNSVIHSLNDLRHGKKVQNSGPKTTSNDMLELQKDVVLHGSCIIFTDIFFDAKLNGYDNRTFLYREEHLLYLMLKRNNLLSIYQPELEIRHLGDVSTDSVCKDKNSKNKLKRDNEIKSLKIVINELAVKDKPMQYIRKEEIAKPISKIVFGCAGNAFLSGKNCDKILDAAFEAGFNTYDTAEVYGQSEQVLGKWIKKRHLRDEVVVIAKGCHPHGGPRVDADSLRYDIEQSLKRLMTDYIDIYMLNRDHPDCDIRALLEVLNEYQSKGMIKSFGVSNWTHERLEYANKIAADNNLKGFTSSNLQMSFARQLDDPWGNEAMPISGDDVACDWYKAHRDIPVFAYSCLGRGMFSGEVKSDNFEETKKYLDKYSHKGYLSDDNIARLAVAEQIAKEKNCSVAQLSLAWLLQQDFDVLPIVSISSPNILQENIKAFDIQLSEDDMQRLY